MIVAAALPCHPRHALVADDDVHGIFTQKFERFAAVGVTIIPPEHRSPEYLAKYIPSEIEKWAGPIKASGATGE